MNIEEIRAIKDMAIKAKDFNVEFAKKYQFSEALSNAKGALKLAADILQMEFNKRMNMDLSEEYNSEEATEIRESIFFLETEADKVTYTDIKQ